jgi:molybdopterin synthase sulfur carrier subunit
MIYEVQLFARAREIAATTSMPVELTSPATVRDLRRLLAASCPRLEPLIARSSIAVNDEYAQDDDALPEHATLALIPPVSGG